MLAPPSPSSDGLKDDGHTFYRDLEPALALAPTATPS